MKAPSIHSWYLRFWRLANPKKSVAYSRRWQINNPNTARQITARYQATEKGQATRIRYRRSPKGLATIRRLNHKHNWQGKVRRALRMGAKLGDPQEMRKIYQRCRVLRQWFNVVVDHKIPLAKGGAHSAENLQIIYAHENARKHARLNYKPRVIFT
jgi:5-methylcytosine-specific restriction endonuclease McrA